MIFQEPMVTKAFIESKPNVATPLVRPQAYQAPGPRPTHYSVRYDAAAKEYRIALEGLTVQ